LRFGPCDQIALDFHRLPFKGFSLSRNVARRARLAGGGSVSNCAPHPDSC